MNTKQTKISNEVLTVLGEQVQVRDGVARIEAQLDRKLYLDVNKVLEGLGGKWSRRLKGHEFAGVEDVAAAIQGVVDTGAFVDLKKAYDAFFTPPAFAAQLAEWLDPKDDDFMVLEPSAGEGALADAVRARAPKVKILCYEAQPRLRELLKSKGYDVSSEPNFLNAKVLAPSAVIMNPPFSGQADIDHVNRALDFCQGGPTARLVAVMSAGVRFRLNAKTVAFRERVAKLGGEFIDNPAGTFESAGTSVNTVTLRVGPR